MNDHRATRLGLAALLVFACVPRLNADENSTFMDYAYIRGSDGAFLTAIGRNVKFSKARPRERTVWDAGLVEGGLRIGPTGSGKLLGINAKTKELELFDKPGPTTTWQAKSANDKEIKPPRAFRALIYMKVGEEELRLSSDGTGTAILGGKADILHFYIDGP